MEEKMPETNEQTALTPPFLKWAGGKRWLTAQIEEVLPEFSGRYIEPFLGSGAIFFHLQPRASILADANVQLIETYQAIQHNWERVVNQLKTHHRNHSPEYYYKVRASKPRTLHTKAAKFIYLNRTCWNGLYRVNLSGEFNVPIGTKKNVVLNSDRFDLTATSLANSELMASDFERVINLAGEN
ncbi:MAG: Dam family site-specific DNA-(adenine-N6)-methyltransferase, partial [Cyclobacteriaceae bacterium]